MTSDPHSPSHSVNKLAAVLADVHVSLALATDEEESLAAVMRYVERFRPSVANLFYLNADGSGRPAGADLVGTWQGGHIVEEEPARRHRESLSEFPLAEAWIKNPHDLLAIEDVESDPRFDARVREAWAASGQRAQVILPLYSVSHSAWQGLLIIGWSVPHVLSEEERFVYALFMQTLSSFLANRRSESALRTALDEASQLYAINVALNSAPTLEAAAQAAALPALARGAVGAFLLVLEYDASGQPDSLQVAAGVDSSGGNIPGIVGTRYPVRGVPLVQLWINRPDEIILIDDIERDPRVDGHTRELYRQSSHRASVVLPLVARRKLLGILTYAWMTPQRFADADHRLYQAIARNAALILDNRLLAEKSERALRENEAQSKLLKNVLEHLPVGVFLLEVPSLRPTLANRQAVELLDRSIEPPPSGESPPPTSFRCVRPGTDEPIPTEEMPLPRTLRIGAPQQDEIDVIGADGQRRSLDVRTAPIFDGSGQMVSAVTHLTDITQRRGAEQERLRMQDALIQAQAVALAERSTPLIPITDEIVVVPLIGSLDTERGNQLIDALLTGVSKNRARVAIIDITGVRTLDTQAANTLTGAAQALRLLGVEPVLTGIRAEVAQTLITLGVRLDGIDTRNNLQSGIAYALKFTGRSALK